MIPINAWIKPSTVLCRNSCRRVSGAAARLSVGQTQTFRPLSMTSRQCQSETKRININKIIADSIKATGPLPISQYMHLCLSHPTDGYYMKGDVFGAEGDFITSPEISQVFGELVGVWLLSQWLEKGSPSNVRLVELGPGRGTLMDDIIRTVLRLGGETFKNSLKSIFLVETSEKLADLQREKLSSESRQGLNLEWCGSIDEVPNDGAYTMIVAHEFFDALPVHIIQNTERGWREVFVGLDENTTLIASPASLDKTVPATIEHKHKFKFVLAPGPSPMASVLATSSPRFTSRPIGSAIEVSPASWSIAKTIGDLIRGPGGGVGLIMDYGDDKPFGDSFRGFRQHKVVDVFDEPGSSDLTANVDFGYLAEAMSSGGAGSFTPIIPEPGVQTPKSAGIITGLITQRDFLLKMGIEVRLKQLLQTASEDGRRKDIQDAVNRLIDKNGMGDQYKFLAVSTKQGTDESSPYPFQKSPVQVERSQPT
ncbi:hypothetical protein FRB94_006626 [Tulasnella sp. JGI-2019a]|nr:hypothetical protein FRB94_006626 [Tulasnella sp. JGI-2019a]